MGREGGNGAAVVPAYRLTLFFFHFLTWLLLEERRIIYSSASLFLTVLTELHCHINNQQFQWFCSDKQREWVHVQLSPWLAQISATCLHNEGWTKHRTTTIPLYSHQWQTLLINHSCWPRRETSHCSAQDVTVSRSELVQESWNLFPPTPGESMILFTLKLFSDDGWKKHIQVNFLPSDIRKLLGNQSSHQSPEFGGKVLVRMASTWQ